MMPPYRYMDSYPHQSNQTPFTPYQVFPTHTPVDPVRHVPLFEPWPCGGNYGYPTSYHSCCNHGNFSGYYSFRPYAQAPMPSPMHFYGGYPASNGEAYPVHYAPPPHYSMELPRYEYDKNMPRSYHCYCCPNHPYNSEEKSVKIEEQEPEVVEKKGSESLVPIQMKNYPDPSIWVPQGYLHNKEQRKPLEPEVAEQQRCSSKTKHPESLKSSEQDPRIWNGWFPLDMNNLRSLMHGGDGKTIYDQQSKEKNSPFPFFWMPSYDNKQEHGKDNADMTSVKDQQSEDHRSEDRKRQFPFPIIWMPSYDKKYEEAEKKDNKDINSPSKCEENLPYTFNIVSATHPGDGIVKDKSGANEENTDSHSGAKMEKIANHRSIPVKQIEPHKEEDNSEDTMRRRRDVPVNKSFETNARRSSSSPPKTPKLSPVCLRVDPLPRKNNGNGNSRSPSPPNVKSRLQENTNGTVKVSDGLEENSQQDSKLEEGISSRNKEVQPNQKEKKLIEVTERKTSDNNDRGQTNVSQIPSNLPMQSTADASNKLVIKKPMEKGNECQTKEDPEASVVGDAIAEEPVEKKKATNPEKSVGDEKKTLSEEEAVVFIQSAYRGFDVRRWEPLKKLKQIAEIREQLVDVRNHIQVLETSSELQKDNKQKVVIGESIMRLLLKLDAIQGLHSSLRVIRKSLARELINFQEKLDSLMIGKSQESEMGVDFKTKEELSTVGQNSECMLKLENHEEIEHGESESTPQDSYVSNPYMIQPYQDEFLQMCDSGHSLKGNASVSSSESSVQHFVAEDDRQKLSIASDVSLREPDAEPLEEPKDEVVNGEPEASATMVEERDKANAASEPNQLVQVSLVVEDKMEILRSDFKASSATCMETEDLEQLPHEITDDVSVAPELEKDTHVEMSKNEVQQASEHESTSEVISAPDFDGVTAPRKDAEVLELPIGVIGEDTASSEFEKNGQDELEKNDDLLVEDKCHGIIDATPLEVVVTRGSEHPNEVHVNSNVEPEQCVKIGCEEDEEHLANLVLEGEKERHEGKEVRNNVPEPEGSEIKISPEEKEIQEDTVGAKAERKEIYDEVSEHLPVLIREEGTETEEKNIDDTEQDKEAGFGTTKEEVLAGTTFDPMNVGQVEHEGEPIPASPTCSLVSTTAETDSGVETNEKLKEENEKLRKMMEKLMEAGKAQLDVMSNLTGRVKDLEKKLAKKKKLRTRQHKAASCASAHVKRSNVPMKERIGGVAM